LISGPTGMVLNRHCPIEKRQGILSFTAIPICRPDASQPLKNKYIKPLEEHIQELPGLYL